MDVSDSDIFNPRHPLRGSLFGGKYRKRRLFKKLFKKPVDVNAAAAEFLDEAAYLDLNNVRRPRTRPTYEYDGDLLQNLDGTSPDESRHWSALPPHEYKQRWRTHFRMTEDVFDQLFAVVAPHMLDGRRHVNKRYRCPTKRHKVLMTISYLAFVPSLREMGAKFGQPHNSLSVVVIRPTLDAMYEALFVSAETKLIRFPKNQEEINLCIERNSADNRLPGCLGAIDGSLIPCRKPTRAQAKGDTDAYYGYKGFISSLLLAVVDGAGSFIYVGAGAPGCTGDTGMFARSGLKKMINAGVLNSCTQTVQIGGVQHEFSPYIVGDRAFVCTEYMMACHNGIHVEGTPEAKFNRRVINTRRVVECAFGRLKARWQFCNSNCHQNDPELVTVAIVVCCCLHNYLESHHVGIDDDVQYNLDHARVGQPLPAQIGQSDSTILGLAKRSKLTSWAAQF